MARKAKKGKAKETAKKAAKKAKPSKAGRATAKAKRAKHRVPSARSLPGMGQVRNAALDRFCVKIGTTRDAINDLDGEKRAIEQSALQQMRRDNVFAYTHHGITLVRVPGEDKLKVSKARDGEASTSADIEEEKALEEGESSTPTDSSTNGTGGITDQTEG